MQANIVIVEQDLAFVQKTPIRNISDGDINFTPIQHVRCLLMLERMKFQPRMRCRPQAKSCQGWDKYTFQIVRNAKLEYPAGLGRREGDRIEQISIDMAQYLRCSLGDCGPAGCRRHACAVSDKKLVTEKFAQPAELMAE